MMGLLLAIDPGETESGWVQMKDGQPVSSGICDNDSMLELIGECLGFDDLAIEMVASYGMPVGKEVFRTVWWSGRFAHAWMEYNDAPREVYRRDVKLHLCGSARAKDANIRQALLDKWGGKDAAIGKAKSPGPLYGIKSHAWAALGVAVTALETRPAEALKAMGV